MFEELMPNQIDESKYKQISINDLMDIINGEEDLVSFEEFLELNAQNLLALITFDEDEEEIDLFQGLMDHLSKRVHIKFLKNVNIYGFHNARETKIQESSFIGYATHIITLIQFLDISISDESKDIKYFIIHK